MSAPACPTCGRPIPDSSDYPLCQLCLFVGTRYTTRQRYLQATTVTERDAVEAQLIREYRERDA